MFSFGLIVIGQSSILDCFGGDTLN